MNIHFLSDTHDNNLFVPPHDTDIVILGGDASNSIEGIIAHYEIAKYFKKDFLVVPGNHDCYRSSYQNTIKKLKDLGINYLDEDTIYTKDGITFVGGCLFTNFRQNTEEPWDHDIIKDNFRHIMDFRLTPHTPEDYVTIFNKTYNNILKYKDQDNVVVVTHFPPKPVCSNPIFPSEPLTAGYFTNDIDIKGFKLWLFGHTHFNMDEVVDGCRLVSNSLGYSSEDTYRAFNPNLIITL